jgi:ABC-type nickel/cobalt efflux system permease component RcnA
MKGFRYGGSGLLASLSALLIWFISTAPGEAHWADMAAAEIVVNQSDVQITLTFPTGLVAFADGDQNGQLSRQEIEAHRDSLQTFLGQQIRLVDRNNRSGVLSLQPAEATTLPAVNLVAPNTHSTLQLHYAWLHPVKGIIIHYGLFLPGVRTAHCLATISQAGNFQTFMFTPNQQVLALAPGFLGSATGLVAIAAAFLWGALHSLSPGHGKTMVGAYLIGQRATPKHALLLALITTITHTLGIFALGLITLLAAQYILPEKLYPWISLVSGIMVIAIGANLLHTRLYSHSHSHPHSHFHPHSHSHPHSHAHSHLPDTPITWQTLFAIGISGGLLPCPAALVLLLGAIALNQVGTGLLLVLAFSLGLATVLAGLGLALLYAKQWFERMPGKLRFTGLLPAMSAAAITLIGIGISAQAVINIVSG